MSRTQYELAADKRHYQTLVRFVAQITDVHNKFWRPEHGKTLCRLIHELYREQMILRKQIRLISGEETYGALESEKFEEMTK
jgi:hypothetical protein